MNMLSRGPRIRSEAIINVFSVTFDQFNVSLLNKSINSFQKKLKSYRQSFEWYVSVGTLDPSLFK